MCFLHDSDLLHNFQNRSTTIIGCWDLPLPGQSEIFSFFSTSSDVFLPGHLSLHPSSHPPSFPPSFSILPTLHLLPSFLPSILHSSSFHPSSFLSSVLLPSIHSPSFPPSPNFLSHSQSAITQYFLQLVEKQQPPSFLSKNLSGSYRIVHFHFASFNIFRRLDLHVEVHRGDKKY